jgi:hypothetical protein
MERRAISVSVIEDWSLLGIWCFLISPPEARADSAAEAQGAALAWVPVLAGTVLVLGMGPEAF